MLTATITALIAAIAAILSPVIQEFLRQRHEEWMLRQKFALETLYSAFSEFAEAYTNYLHTSGQLQTTRSLSKSAAALAPMLGDERLREYVLGVEASALLNAPLGVSDPDYHDLVAYVSRQIACTSSPTRTKKPSA